MTPYLELFKVEFREFCVVELVLRQIDDVFSVGGFTKASPNTVPGGARRYLVEEYYASADWEDVQTVRRFLKVVEAVLLLSFLTTEAKDHLRQLCTNAGFDVDTNGHTVHITGKGVSRQLKNLIFAADGPKPEIVLSDSVSNDVEIVKNAEYCLIYDRPLKSHGLLWRELVDWWSGITATDGETPT